MKENDIVICRRKEFPAKMHVKSYIDLEIGEFYIVKKVYDDHAYYKPDIILDLYGKSNYFLASNFDVLKLSDIPKILSENVDFKTKNHAVITILAYIEENSDNTNIVRKELNYLRYNNIENDLIYSSVRELTRMIKAIEDNSGVMEITELFNKIMDSE